MLYLRSLLIKIALSTCVVFLPLKSTMVVVVVLTFVDLLSGLAAAKKQGDPITSSGLKRTILKILAYEMVIMLSFLVEQYLSGDVVPLVKIMGGMIGITELKSVLENIEIISGIPLVKLLIDKLTQQIK